MLRARHLALILPLLAIACTQSETEPATSSTGGAQDPCAVHVAPGADDQTAVQTALIDANPGEIVCLGEGTFHFQTELSIDTLGTTLRGAGQDETILSFATQDIGANGILIRGDGVTIEDLQVLNTPGDGIRADAVDGVTFQRVTVAWDAAASTDNGAYGLYPVGSDHVLIDACVVHGARDAGIYVGQSTNIVVKDSEAWGNVAGIEIENSTDAEVMGCHAHDNTGGILVFNLPGLPVKDGKRANVHDNVVENNDLPNFGAAGTIVSKVPAGLGVMVLAADDNEIHHNTITGNASAGVLFVSYIDALFGVANDDAFDHYPQGNWAHDNTFAGNGDAPDTLVETYIAEAPVPDVLWDGCEDANAIDDGHLDNCLSDNGAATYLDFNFCLDAPDKSTDITAVTCTYEPLGHE